MPTEVSMPPQSLDELLVHLRENFATLSTQFQGGARYLLDHPQEIRPIHFSHRASSTDVLSFTRMYPALRHNELVDGTGDKRFRDAWEMAQAGSFLPAALEHSA